MKLYQITISVNVPYPKEYQFQINASSVGTAIQRSLKQLRKHLPRKQIKEYKIKAIQL